MSAPPLIDEISSKFATLMATSPARDIEKNLRAVVASGMERLDLVTREEFDIQRELLDRARARMVALEQRVAELEAQLGKRA